MDYIKNEDIRAEVNMYATNERIEQGGTRWKEHNCKRNCNKLQSKRKERCR